MQLIMSSSAFANLFVNPFVKSIVSLPSNNKYFKCVCQLNTSLLI